jgi:hypothetical protein
MQIEDYDMCYCKHWIVKNQNFSTFKYTIGKDNLNSSSSDDEGTDTVFRTTFGGARFYWSFHWSNSRSHNSYNSSHRWTYDSDEDDDDDDESFHASKTRSEMALARQTLGLSTLGPLKLEEVKIA